MFGLVLVVALLGACSDAPDRGPNDAQALALAASLTREDVPRDGWRATEQAFEDLHPTPDPDATPFALPPGFEACDLIQEALDHPPTPPQAIEAAAGRSFFEGAPSGTTAFVMTSTLVFSTAEQAEGYVEETWGPAQASASDGLDGECMRAFAAAATDVHDGSAMIVRRKRDPGFTLRGLEISQFKMTVSSSAGIEASVSTSAVFTRGHVVATYNANESEEGAIDHEAVLRAFIQRVTDAELADREATED
ncbi:MAG: hypothetical protein O3A10_06700 [Chloroflexi bacterium]|nr:hypothetical protein [Chloroflexota bacterium]MDA1147057.1 hypothetical protein [Chloroflexota bacterium]